MLNFYGFTILLSFGKFYKLNCFVIITFYNLFNFFKGNIKKLTMLIKYIARIDDKTYPALKRYSNESGIPIDELASSMIAFAICQLVIEEYDPKKQRNKSK